MHNFLEKLQHARHAVRFAPERKKAVRDYLVRMTAADVVLRAPRKDYRTLGSFFARPMPVLAGIMGLVLVGGSTSFAAQSALPGELLYPVKVGVTEKIVEAVQFSPDAQAEYAAELAERRLDEAAELTLRGDLTSTAEEELAERFTEHASRARTALTAVRAESAERADHIAAVFEDALRTREHAFGNDTEDELAAAKAPRSVSDIGTSPGIVSPAPALMAAPAAPASDTVSSSAESATSSATAPSADGPSFRAQKNSGQGNVGERSKRVLRTKVRDSLREIQAFRKGQDVPVLRPRSQDGGNKPSGQVGPEWVQHEVLPEPEIQGRQGGGETSPNGSRIQGEVEADREND